MTFAVPLVKRCTICCASVSLSVETAANADGRPALKKIAAAPIHGNKARKFM
jgi:hypothetical protein